MAERYGAILAHVYQIRESQKDTTSASKIRSSRRGHMQVSALTQLIREGKTNVVFIAGGQVWGQEYPAFANLMGQELKNRLEHADIKHPEIVINPKAMTTDEEIGLFLKEGDEKGWNPIASVANKRHAVRIKKIYESRRRPDVEVINAEDVLANVEFGPKARRPYKPFLEAFRWSKMEMIFMARELVITTFYRLGLEGLLRAAAKSTRVQKGKVWFDS